MRRRPYVSVQCALPPAQDLWKMLVLFNRNSIFLASDFFLVLVSYFVGYSVLCMKCNFIILISRDGMLGWKKALVWFSDL